jgi:hypothetical protein
MTPYWAELGGANGVLTLVAEICAHHGVTDGKMILAFDSESAIKTLRAEKDPKVHATDYDMAMECRRQIRALPVKVEIMWIRGHQDKVAGSVLDWWARQNVRMDARTKNYCRKCKGQVLGPIQLSTVGRSSAGLMGKTKCQDGCKNKKTMAGNGKGKFWDQFN